jgi:hypothetical protein
VTDVKDLGSGVIGDVECDYMAFRKKDVDFQIWVAQGNKPYPCRFTITSRTVPGGPQYSIQIRNWKTGGEVASADFTFTNASNANKIEGTFARSSAICRLTSPSESSELQNEHDKASRTVHRHRACRSLRA